MLVTGWASSFWPVDSENGPDELARSKPMLAEMDMTRAMNNMGTVFLDPDQKSPRAQDFEERLTSRIVPIGRFGGFMPARKIW